MQTISPAYNPYPDVRRALLRVKFGLVDVAAAGDATPTANQSNAVARIGQIINGAEGMGGKYATLEHNQFSLDGSMELFPDDPSATQIGWWSAQQSDNSGVFPTKPTLTFNFTVDHSSIGFTVVFDDQADEYCTDFIIKAYNASNALIASKAIAGNRLAYCPVSMQTDNYRKIVIEFERTNRPHRYVRVAQVLFGIIQTHTASNSGEVEMLYEIDPTTQTLPANEFTITIDNQDRRYNLISPDGLYRFLQQGQALDVEIGVGPPGEIEYVNMGRYYYDMSASADNSLTATITGFTPLYFLTGKYRKGKIGTATVKSFIEGVLADSGWAMTVVDIGGVGSRAIKTQCDPVTHREAIRLAAQAARCVCMVSRGDTLVLVDPVIGAATDTLTLDNQADYPVVRQIERVNTINVTTTDYYSPLSDDDSKLCTAQILVSGTVDRWFEYNSPARTAAATVSGGTLVSAEYHMHAAKLRITGSGTVTVNITGKTYDSADVVHMAQMLEPGENEQPENINNPLCADGQALAEWLLNYYRYAFEYRVTDRGNPAREPGDSAQIFDAYGEDRTALVTRIQLHYDGGLSGEMTAIGGLDG